MGPFTSTVKQNNEFVDEWIDGLTVQYKQKQNYMAFVINKTQYKSLFDTSNPNPGPGAYKLKEAPKQEHPAPFNASASKISCFQVKQSNLGPGSYIKTSTSECFKPKSTCVAAFKSQAARFPYQQKNRSRLTTQPQQPDHSNTLLQSRSNRPKSTQSSFHKQKTNQKKQYLLELRKRNQQRKINSIVNHEKGKVRILLSNPHNTENIESFYIEDYVNVKQANGPGQYEVGKEIGDKNRSVISWANDKQRRFRKSKSMINTNPGPGSYELAHSKKTKTSHSKKHSSSFSSGGVRSFMDTVIYKTTNQMKAQIMESKKLKDPSPGPGDYSPQKPVKDSFYYGKEIMISSIQRFGMDKNKVRIPGPGHYNNVQCKLKYTGLVKEMRQKIFGKQGTLVRENNEEEIVPLQKQLSNLKQEDYSLHHDLVPCTLKQRCQSKAGTISHEPRFKQAQKTKEPGPGQYYTLFDVKCPPQTSGVFKSGTQRQPFLLKKQNDSQTFYDVSKEDIAARTRKLRENMQNLKKVAIQKPAFDSSVVRFSPTKVQNTKSDKKLNKSYTESYQRDQIDYDSFKPYKQKTSYASVFRSTTTRQPFIVKQNPGPGSYDKKDLLNKVSFNIEYRNTQKQKEVSGSKLERK